jgi:hypothetical protein
MLQAWAALSSKGNIMLLVRYILLFTLTAMLIMCGRVSAWSESGHHIIAVLAFDLLNESEQNELLRILTAHPRYSEDFSPPDKIRNVNRWRVGALAIGLMWHADNQHTTGQLGTTSWHQPSPSVKRRI